MKPITTLLSIVIAGLSFWGGTVYTQTISERKESDQTEPYRKQVESVMGELTQQYTNSLERGIANAATVLSKNRDFVLSYYLDHDLANPVVAGIASQYGELLAVDGLQIINSDSIVISKFGIAPSESTISKPVDIIIDSMGTLWIGSVAKAGIGKEELSLFGWIKVDSARLTKLSEITKSEMLIMRNDELLLSTILGIEMIHRVSPEIIRIDSLEQTVITTPLSDSLTLLSLSPIKGSN